jgi:hypothetical protein
VIVDVDQAEITLTGERSSGQGDAGIDHDLYEPHTRQPFGPARTGAVAGLPVDLSQ